MYKIYIKRTCEVKVPFDLYVETNDDWTHFSHLHHKTVKDYRLLFKRDQREVFLYKGRRLYPLPFYDHYIVFRNYEAATHGYRNVYLNVHSRAVHYLTTAIVPNGETSKLVSEFMFSLPTYWRFFPGLFLWAFKRRMRKVMDEDNEWMYERMAAKATTSQPQCAPRIPPEYDLFKDLIPGGAPETSDIRFEYALLENFDDKPDSFRAAL